MAKWPTEKQGDCKREIVEKNVFLREENGKLINYYPIQMFDGREGWLQVLSVVDLKVWPPPSYGPPGSAEAIENGCLCPERENRSVTGRRFWVAEACPLHGDKKAARLLLR